MAAQVYVPEEHEDACDVFLPPSTAVDWPLTRQQKFQRVLDMFEQELQSKEEELQLREQELCLKDAEIQSLRHFIAESKAHSGAGSVRQPGDKTVEASVDLSPFLGRDAKGPFTFRGPAEQIAAVLLELAKSKDGPAASRRLSTESMFTVLSAECDSRASTPRASAAAAAAPQVRRRSLRPRLPCLELGGLGQLSSAPRAEVSFAPPLEAAHAQGTAPVAHTPRNVCLGTPRATPFVATPRSQPRVYALATPRGSAPPQPVAGGSSPMKARPGASPLQRLQESPGEERSSLGSEESSKADVEEALSPIATPSLEAQTSLPSMSEHVSSDMEEPAMEPAIEPRDVGAAEQLGAEVPTTNEVDSFEGAAEMRTPERIMLEASPTRPRLRIAVASPSPRSSENPTSQDLFAEQLVKLGPQNCAAALQSLSPSKQLAVAEAVKVIAEASAEVSNNEAMQHDPFASPLRAPSAEKAIDTIRAVGEPQTQSDMLPWRLRTPMKRKEAAAQLAARAKEGGLSLSRKMAAGFESFSTVGQKATNTITDRWAEECAFRYAQHQLGKR